MKRYRARRNDYLNRETNKLRSVWHPQVKVDGQWCYLPDDSTPTTLMEAPDEMTAVELAIKAVREIDAQQTAEKGAEG